MMIHQRGFSLIELVIGLIALMALFAVILNVLMPQAERSVDPIFQVRAAELAQGILEEISSHAFDEASTLVFGSVRCGEIGLGASVCTTLSACPNNAPPEREEANRLLYDDVDDYNCLVEVGNNILTGSGGNLAIYEGFSVEVVIGYDENLDGVISLTPENGKLINVTVETPSGERLAFSTYRFNN